MDPIIGASPGSMIRTPGTLLFAITFERNTIGEVVIRRMKRRMLGSS